MPDTVYNIVITETGFATIKKIEAAVRQMNQSMTTSMAATSEAAARAEGMLKRLHINYQSLGAMGESMHAQLTRNISGSINQQALNQLKQAGLIVDDVADKGKRGFSNMAAGAKKAADESAQFHRTLERLQRTALAFIGMWVLTKVLGFPKEVISTAIEYNSELETAQLGMSAILMAQGEFTNSIGESVQGYDKLIKAQEMSAGIIKQLQIDNLSTIATMPQLVKAFQQTLSPGLAKGFDVEQVREFTVAMVQAAGAMGLNLDMMAEETRSLLRGTISPRQTLIATALGITNKDIRQFQGDADALFAYLMKKLEAFKIAGIMSQTTWSGLTSNLKDAVKMLLGIGFEDLFKYAKTEVKALFDYIVIVDTMTGRMKINPELLESMKSWVWLIQVVYEDIKRTLLLLGELRVPIDILVTSWQIIAKSAEAWNKALSIKVEGSGLGSPELVKGFGEKFGLSAEVMAKAEETQKSKYAGKGFLDTISMLLKDYRKGMDAVETGYYTLERHRLNEMKYRANVKELQESEVDYLLKVASETGYVNEALRKKVQLEANSKNISIDLFSYSGKALQVAIATVQEYTKLKDAGEDTQEGFDKLLKNRLAIVAIETAAVPMKMALQVAQANEEYEVQKKLLVDLNTEAIRQLRLTTLLTPELERQLNLQTKMGVADVGRAKESASINRLKDLTSMELKYAEMTEDVDGQIRAMEKSTGLVVRELLMQVQRSLEVKNQTEQIEKQKDLWEKIMLILKQGAHDVELVRIKAPIDIRKPYYAAEAEMGKTKGDMVEYEKFAKLMLEDEIAIIRHEKAKFTELERYIQLKRDLFDLVMAIDKVEAKNYMGDKIASARATFGELTGNLQMQKEASAVLFKSSLERLEADPKIGGDKNKAARELLFSFLRQIEAIKDTNRELEKQKEILGFEKDLASIKGDYLGVSIKVVEILEKERQTLVQKNASDLKAVSYINDYYDQLVRIAEARKNLDIGELINIGAQRNIMDLTNQLADAYENVLPNAIKSVESAFSTFFDNIIDGTKSMSDILKDLWKNLANDIIKELYRVFVVKQLTGLIAGGIGSLFGTGVKAANYGATAYNAAQSLPEGYLSLATAAEGAIWPSMLAHYPLKAYSSGGIASSPQIGIFGEGGEREAFVPLKSGKIPVQMSGVTGGPNGVISGSNVIINIINKSEKAKTEYKESEDGKGNRSVEIIISEIVAGEAKRHGSVLNKSLISMGSRNELVRR